MKKKNLPANPSIKLPELGEASENIIGQITTALSVDREVLPATSEIEHVWSNLPRLLKKIPPELRDLGMIRLCVAASVGLFDSSINYVWNSTIIELRRKVKAFGLAVVGQVTSKTFSDTSLNELKDYELLKLCLELNLISEEAYFKLDQCRAIRNNFSAAHPSMGDIDEDEVVSFISRCAKYALSNAAVPSGVDVSQLIKAIKADKFSKEQESFWKSQIGGTHSAQKAFLITTLHGLYCDESLAQTSRSNCLALIDACVESDDQFTNAIDSHQNYKGQALDPKVAASRDFFTKCGRLYLLSDAEIHEVFSKDCDRLMQVHQSMDNFYNEVPFGERLFELSEKTTPPASVRAKFVECVVTCSVGNQYGTSRAADIYYKKMIESFTPAEISVFLSLPTDGSLVRSRIKTVSRCKKKFIELVQILDEASIPTSLSAVYKKWSQ